MRRGMVPADSRPAAVPWHWFTWMGARSTKIVVVLPFMCYGSANGVRKRGAPLGKLVLEGKAGWDAYEMPWPLLDGRETFLAELGEWFSRHDGRAIRLTVEVVEPESVGVLTPSPSSG